jgi:hypothetical protein
VYDEDLNNLEESLRRLKVDYHIFFSGNRRKPPEDQKIRLERLVKKLSECSDMSPAQRFRFNTLITRFYVYRDLWRRTMQSRESSEEIKAEADLKSAVAAPAAKSSASQVRISISDPKTDEQKIQQLYDALLRIKGTEAKEPPLSYQQFAKYIAAQTRSICERHNCSAVAFTIALEENAIRFTATAENL